MAKFFQPNLDRKGRIARIVFPLACIVAGLVCLRFAWWVCALLVALGLFAFFEAGRGWCLMRACGIKTRF
jgi:hypothetical protein